jgi:glycosyltransferase involved in cell wall biosynthesis
MFVGSGKHEQVFRNMVRDFHLEQQVIFAGFRRDIEEIIALFDIAVFTSLWEGLPRVVVQYAAVGKPIVAFAISGVSEIVHPGVNGLTVPVQDVDALAQQIIYLLHNPDRAKQMGKKGPAMIDDTWQAEHMVARIAQEYRALSQASRLRTQARP